MERNTAFVSAASLMRSKLFVPASRSELFEKAVASAADALSFDLEDAVVKERKVEARGAVAEYLRRRPTGIGKVTIVRVNAVGTDLFSADLAAVAGPGLDMINLPMVEELAQIVEAAEQLDRIPATGHIRLLITIETPKGLHNAWDLAASHPRISGLQIGYADLLEPCGIERSDHAALTQIRLSVRMAAAAADIPAYDGAFLAVADSDGYRAECEAARRHGFAGKTCIHPSQVAIANRAFMPTRAQVERARRVLAAAEEAEAKGIGACLVDGEMIDTASLTSARAIIAFADLHATALGGQTTNR
jgi:citrate lyase subunit beta / citryl-CoA lyase